MTSPIDLFAAFATDTKAEEVGISTTVPGAGDTEFLVARAGNSEYTRKLQRLVKQNRTLLDSKGKQAEAKSDEILIDVMATTILLGWKGTINYRGEALAYSLENAKKLLALKEFRAAVSKVADDFETFRAVKEEEDSKN